MHIPHSTHPNHPYHPSIICQPNPRYPSISLPLNRVDGDDDMTNLPTFASKHASAKLGQALSVDHGG